ncbi:tail protein X [Dryocola clanedunensis]|uniref:tail protein X n=1 Tax=Cedecea sulfonylureivorans TaxID=3051154 RepID=UPI00192943D0|nr:tail protein X [Cedecea sulfonylureivorans]
MPTIYQTRDGDVLDAIVAEHYGTAGASAMVSQVLEANQGLSEKGDIYPARLLITLPDLPPVKEESPFQLWD